MSDFYGGKFTAEVFPIHKIEPDPKQIRLAIPRKGLDELADSVRKVGIVVPLIGFRHDGKIRLIAGHRRLLAAKLAGLKSVPVVIRESTSGSNLVGQAVENLAREEMNVRDTCVGLRRVQKELACSQAVLARVVGRSEAYVSQVLAYDSWPMIVKSAVDGAHLAPSAARHLAQIGDAQYLQAALRDAIEHGMSESQAIAWKKTSDSAQTTIDGAGRSPATRDEVDPEKHKATCDLCHKRESWSHAHTVTLCNACYRPKPNKR